MKKTINFFAIAIAIATVGLNLSIDSNGKLSFLQAKAANVETTVPDTAEKYQKAFLDCKDDEGNIYYSFTACKHGEDDTCEPEGGPCPPKPSTAPPSTPGDE
jgi:hypothetical protein